MPPVFDPDLIPLVDELEADMRRVCPGDFYQPHHTGFRGPRAGKPTGQLQFHSSRHAIRIMAPGNGWGGTMAMGYEIDAWCRRTNRWQETPEGPIKAIWFCPEFRQMALVLAELRANCFGTGVKFRESGFGGPHLEWENGSKLYFASYDRDWSHLQGVALDLVAFDEQPPADLYREMLQRRRGKRKTRFICKATQTVRGGWMKELYLDWLAHHRAAGMDEEEAMHAQEHPDLWLWPRGGIHDNPGMSDEDVTWYETRQWPTEQERRVRLFGGFEDLGADAYFPVEGIERYKAAHCLAPMYTGSLDCGTVDIFEREWIISQRKIDRLRWQDDPAGSWRAWWPLDERPDQAHAYVIGVDLGYGVGASNSVMSVANADTRTKIAEFACASKTPEQIAALTAMMGMWLGGRLRTALICFESNGPGESFAKSIAGLRYHNLYGEQKAPTAVGADNPGRIGWRSGHTAKEILLSDYRAALMSERFINPSTRAIESCLSFRVDSKGRIISEGEASADGARAPHGDFTIADGLAWLACQHVGRQPMPVMPVERGTLAGFLKDKDDERRRRERW